VRAFFFSFINYGEKQYAKSVLLTVYGTVLNGPFDAGVENPWSRRDILGTIGDADDVGVCHRPMPAGRA
jgi:hypothetical protein